MLLLFILWTIFVFFAGGYFGVSFKHEATGFYMFYSMGPGVRNKKKLF